MVIKLIDWQITKHETKKDKEYFNRFPNSAKKVYRICDKCNKGLWVEFRNSYKLCRSCSLTGRKLSDEHKKNMKRNKL